MKKQQPVSWRRHVFGSSVRPILVNIKNVLKEFLQHWHKHPLGLREKSITIWWFKFKVQGHSELTKQIFWPLFNNFMIVLYSILLKWWSYLFLYPKGQRSTCIWRHNILQEKCSGHDLTAKLENSNLNGAKGHICNHTAADLVGQFKVVFLAMKKIVFWDVSSCAGGYKPRCCF